MMDYVLKSVPLYFLIYSANGLVVMISRCQRGEPGSIPGWRTSSHHSSVGRAGDCNRFQPADIPRSLVQIRLVRFFNIRACIL